jgi:hypothetical protein
LSVDKKSELRLDLILDSTSVDVDRFKVHVAP